MTTIDYDINLYGLYDKAGTDFEVLGFTSKSIKSTGGSNSLRIQAYKIQDDTNNKMTLQTIEDTTLDTTGIIDNLRSGGNDRTHTGTSLFFSDTSPVSVKFFDYNTYFLSSENIFTCKTKFEGLIIKLTWTAIDNCDILLRTRNV